MPRFIHLFVSIAVFILISSCSVEERPVPAKLPSSERESMRALPFDGAENFRDLGGYETPDGEKVKWGLLYRSGQLHDLTDADREYLRILEISTIADFRGPSEIEDEPDDVPREISWKSYPVNVAGSELREKIVSVIKGDSDMNLTGYMLEINQQFAMNYTDTYGEWIHDLADNPDSTPQIFHCTAGKDRAGFAAAILLRILGIPEETVIADYLKSNIYNAEYIEKTIKKIKVLTFFKNDGEVIRPLLTVDREYLQTAFNSIDAEWGSFDNYIHQGLGLSDAEIKGLKNRFLE